MLRLTLSNVRSCPNPYLIRYLQIFNAEIQHDANQSQDGQVKRKVEDIHDPHLALYNGTDSGNMQWAYTVRM